MMRCRFYSIGNWIVSLQFWYVTFFNSSVKDWRSDKITQTVILTNLTKRSDPVFSPEGQIWIRFFWRVVSVYGQSPDPVNPRIRAITVSGQSPFRSIPVSGQSRYPVNPHIRSIPVSGQSPYPVNPRIRSISVSGQSPYPVNPRIRSIPGSG